MSEHRIGMTEFDYKYALLEFEAAAIPELRSTIIGKFVVDNAYNYKSGRYEAGVGEVTDVFMAPSSSGRSHYERGLQARVLVKLPDGMRFRDVVDFSVFHDTMESALAFRDKIVAEEEERDARYKREEEERKRRISSAPEVPRDASAMA